MIDAAIRFGGLKSGRYDYEYDLDDTFFAAFENENLTRGAVHFDVRLEKKERVMLLSFSFNGEVETECDRCLEPMIVNVDGEETLYVKVSDEEVSDDCDDVILPEGTVEIDLSQWLYEFVLVSIPMQHIHPDDKDGNPTCNPEMLSYINGADGDEEPSLVELDIEEIDPRWEALKKLK